MDPMNSRALYPSEHDHRGEWTGTMNLTEPQAGSDLAAINSRAVPEDDHYLVTGQKDIYYLGRPPDDGKHHSPGAGTFAGRTSRCTRVFLCSWYRNSCWMTTAIPVRAE